MKMKIKIKIKIKYIKDNFTDCNDSNESNDKRREK